MNKFWKEIERLSNKNEEQINKELAKAYKLALEDLKMRIGAFMAEHQNLRYVDMLQLNKLESLYKQVDAASRNVIDAVKDGTYKADLRELELGYFGEFYTIESQLKDLDMGSNLSFGLMSEEYIKEVVEYPVNGIPLSERLYGETLPSMQRQIKATITEGLIQGYSYKEISRNLSESMDNSYRKSKTIVRTESGRVRSMARQEAVTKAKDLGVDIKKEWVATLDKNTRHSHASMDSQIVETDEEFVSPRGHKAMQPRMFGVAAEDINCRCGCTSVVSGMRAKSRRDNIDKTVGDYGNYEEWLKKKHPKEYEKFKEISKEVNNIFNKNKDLDSIRVKNLYNDARQYKNYKKILGNNMPKSIDKFQDIKYNNSEWELFKSYTSLVNTGELTPLADFDLYKKTSSEIDSLMIGKATSNGIIITGKSKHYIARTIGSVSQKRNGVSVEEALNALIRPTEILDVKVMSNGKSQKFRADGVEISINPDTGILIQANPKKKRVKKS